MKNLLPILATLLVVMAHTALFAQDLNDINSLMSKKSDRMPHPESGSVVFAPYSDITSGLVKKADSTSAFSYHLPKVGTSTERVKINAQTWSYNMSIAKPQTNSKMFIAKLDSSFPYQYKMPILSYEGVNRKEPGN